MARCPAAVWRPLPEAASQPPMTATQVILHTACDAPGPSSLWGFFAQTAVPVESHFFVKLDGAIEQYVDTDFTADANRTANVRAISIETEDEGDPDRRPWTPAQLDAIARLLRWCADTHGIPLAQCPAHDRPGIGWHSMWGAPSPWTPAAGKTCPGPARIPQIPALIAAARALGERPASTAPTPPTAPPIPLPAPQTPTETLMTYLLRDPRDGVIYAWFRDAARYSRLTSANQVNVHRLLGAKDLGDQGADVLQVMLDTARPV